MNRFVVIRLGLDGNPYPGRSYKTKDHAIWACDAVGVFDREVPTYRAWLPKGAREWTCVPGKWDKQFDEIRRM